jgi:hypothetical protein
MRLLAQVPSASACERNWSAYKFVHSEKRNRLGKKRARDVVNAFQNLRATKGSRVAEMDIGQIVSNSGDDLEVEHSDRDGSSSGCHDVSQTARQKRCFEGMILGVRSDCFSEESLNCCPCQDYFLSHHLAVVDCGKQSLLCITICVTLLLEILCLRKSNP